MKRLFLGIKGQVVCINKENGAKQWSTKLKGSTLTNIVYEENYLYAFSGGHLFCLNAETGEILWENSLPGMGYGPCIIATENQNAAVISHQVAAQQAAMLNSSVVTSSPS